MFPRILLFGAVTACSVGSTAFAQIWQPACASCAPAPIVQYIAPQPCYTTVPVTEMREYRHVVQKPVVETKYVDQKVTTYEPVVEDRETEIPTVSYQNVTECRQVTRDCGHWTTQLQYRPKMSPCQYDNRPDLFGFLNRVGYSVRSAFTPNYSAHHAYVPNVQTVNVPYTRRVAVHGTRKVNYRITRMIPRTTTQKVAVNTVRMVSQQVVTRRPVTVYRSVPLGGTAMTYATPLGTASARGPVPDSNFRSARKPGEDTRLDSQPIQKRENEDYNLDHHDAGGSDDSSTTIIPRKKIEFTRKVPAPAAESRDFRLAGYRSVGGTQSTAARVGQWMARRTPARPATAAPQGPAFPAHMMAMLGEN